MPSRRRSPKGSPGTVEDRLGALLDDFFVEHDRDEADLWRALLAEAIHGDDDVLQPLLDTERAVRSRARRLDPRRSCPDAPALHDADVVRAIRHALYGVMVEHLPQPEGRRAALAARARELAHVFARASEPVDCRRSPT